MPNNRHIDLRSTNISDFQINRYERKPTMPLLQHGIFFFDFIIKKNIAKMNKPFYGVATIPKSQRSNIVPTFQVPGPGTYDFNKEKSHNELPKWSLKKRMQHGSCFENLSITPGPGVYQPEQHYEREPGKKIGNKGEKYRHFVEKTYSHSPLNLPGSLNLKGGFSFGYREIFKEAEKSPGPIYHLDKVQQEKRTEKEENSFRGFGFGQKNHIYKKDDKSPGPGEFETPNLWKSKTCESWTFGSGKRTNSSITNPLGPGEYDPKTSSVARSFKLRGKNESKIVIDNNTGPGSYDIPDTKTKIGTRFNSPKAGKHEEEHQRRSEDGQDLSPFSYDPPRYLDSPTHNGYSLGMKLKTSQDTAAAQLPGPGAYEISHKPAQNSGGYMGRKLQQKMRENAMDNFYKYEPKIAAVARQSPKFTFSQSKRLDGKENAQRSAYCQEFYQSIDMKSSTCSYSMGTSKRFPDLKKDSGPFKPSLNDYSTIGNLPSYLKKNSKKKI